MSITDCTTQDSDKDLIHWSHGLSSPLEDATRIVRDCSAMFGYLSRGLQNGSIASNKLGANCFIVHDGLWLTYPAFFRSLYDNADDIHAWRQVTNMLMALSAVPGSSARAYIYDHDRYITLPSRQRITLRTSFYINKEMLERFNFKIQLLHDVLERQQSINGRTA